MKLEQLLKGLEPIKNLMLVIIIIITIKMISGIMDAQLVIMTGNGGI